MPELPEVETMVRSLRPALVGRVVGRLEVLDPLLLQGVTAAELERISGGKGVVAVGRRGKWVVVELDGAGGIIVIQPRMSGGFRLDPGAVPPHARLAFRMRGSPATVWYCDTRRLGKVARYDDRPAAEAAFARSHGPDALEIGRDDLAARLKRTDRGIKPTLLDQKVLAGVGNIYADEILHRARLHPERPASGLSAAEVDRLHAAIAPILLRAIEAEGSSFDGNYRTLLGGEGGYLRQSLVHHRAGEPCRSCGTAVLKTRIAGLIGRPTYYCTTCQPLPKTRRARPGP
ncbi:MAG TPA: bifunctional DNA-formamidopyrimidine glycosylase/DNA-(apurinic or apyrimidinic site) lyase [Isosphaeraceae bacterium]|jgi:formamidopyrimidine-DNA glycosylase|nr:bifunctional DNA-formamidopyrimidine glycosylase/DNA-(apurinic or apyrimidinic site) lyase [Isosphaeraceae bacterium]